MTMATERPLPGPTLDSRAGNEPGAAVRLFDELYAGNDLYCRPGAEDFAFRYISIGDEQVCMRRFQLDGYLRGDLRAGDGFVVQWLTRGRGRLGSGAAAVTVLPESAPTLFPTGLQFPIEYEDVDQRLVHVGVDLLRSVADEQDLPDRPLDPRGDAPPTAAAVARWRASVTGAVAAFRVDGPESSAWRQATRDVAGALLELFPAQVGPLREPSIRRSDARLVTAIRFVYAHAHEPIVVSDIAAAAGMSVRSVQEAFRRNLRMSPMAYVREVRLEQAHAELRAADSSDAMVASIARRWGFNHMGRFSATYAQRFGEQPRRTLHQP